jgi:hypothetical protein
MKPLRKRHLQIWTVWAILIPVGIITAYVNVPKKATGNIISSAEGKTLPVVINTVDKTSYTVTLRSSEDKKQWQLDWVNKEASLYPSSLIYKTNNGNTDLQTAEIIGRVEAKGRFYFPLLKDSSGNYRFVLYDIIHKQIIDSIIFKTPL